MKIDYNEIYYNNYFYNNYYERFIPDCGVEEIFDLLKKIDKPVNWLDLGSGGISLFWALAIDKIISLSISDFSNVSLELHKKKFSILPIPRGYSQAANSCKIINAEERYSNAKNAIKKYHVINAFSEWEIESGNFDLITCFGVFSLSGSLDSFLKCFQYAEKNLRKGGSIIGANWILSESYSEKININNNYLNDLKLFDALNNFGLYLSKSAIVELNDKDYKSVLIYELVKV
ncbi:MULTISPECIES: hypothetical protein [Photorhabdus]|uniref:SAM-dependent methyltransferase n=1 Tax=Photorhabdus bodei TaxID=2029681 RepID=A0AAW6BTC2_9GAMM|nr:MULTISPECIES: hypothetical protein [Photorhabdus]MCT8354383.1 hypothetical protein [Photorhabdus kayaii]MDB6374945.1 hypothetical protein [Photorhabdus bodei]